MACAVIDVGSFLGDSRFLTPNTMSRGKNSVLLYRYSEPWFTPVFAEYILLSSLTFDMVKRQNLRRNQEGLGTILEGWNVSYQC